MNFEIYLTEQLKKHPSIKPQDVIKMCYQGAHGAEHLLSDTDTALESLQKEYALVSPAKDELFEVISDDVCRVNLASWKGNCLPLQWLFRMFAASCKVNENAKERFASYLQEAEKILNSAEVSFTKKEWDGYFEEYKKAGMPAVHHSREYREKENPSYRIVNSRFCRAFPILEGLTAFCERKNPCVIAIDGRAASGKTTLARLLQLVLDADVIHMDDFFLPPSLRSKERFETAGENIHHERFSEEVLPFISKGEAFSYRIFDCGKMDYNGRRNIGKKPFLIVEGSYSCHPKFGSYADLTVFADVDADEQTERIRQRNGEEMLKSFLSRWIPMEEEYFKHYGIKASAHIIV
ncbi:MAG: hypothetical protein IJB76_07295 [Clostridia bacterium]|nr:hypothetical protein [Clostridia bacterium]